MADEIEGMTALRTELNRLKGAVEDPKPALQHVGVIALDSFKEHIELGGPGWAPNKTGTPLLRKTGRLFNSFTANSADDIFRLGDHDVEVGTNVEYARPLQDGSRGRPAKGREGKLAAMLGGAGFFRHEGALVGGMPARVFVDIDEKTATLIRSAFADYVMGVTRGNH